MKLHHLAIASLDPERLAGFYVSVLGFERMQKSGTSVWLKLGDAILMIEQSALNDVARPFGEKRQGLHLVAFAIGAAERHAWLETLAGAKVAIADQSAYSIYFFDPEGNRVALSHYPDAAGASAPGSKT